MIHFIMKNVSLEKHTNATKVFSMAMCSGVNPASVRQCTLQPVGRGRGRGGGARVPPRHSVGRRDGCRVDPLQTADVYLLCPSGPLN